MKQVRFFPRKFGFGIQAKDARPASLFLAGKCGWRRLRPPAKGRKKSGKTDFAVVYIDLACNLIARLTPARLGPLNADGTVAVRPGETVSTQKRFSPVVDKFGVTTNPGGGTKLGAAVRNADTAGVLTTEFFSPDQVGNINGGDSGSGITNADGELIGAVAVSTGTVITETRDSEGACSARLKIMTLLLSSGILVLMGLHLAT
jgi:hypothetical protein